MSLNREDVEKLCLLARLEVTPEEMTDVASKLSDIVTLVNQLQTAEGAMNEIGNILGRMRELAVQSASDTMNTNDRSSIDLEFEQLKAEITRIADSTEYNGEAILDGS